MSARGLGIAFLARAWGAGEQRGRGGGLARKVPFRPRQGGVGKTLISRDLRRLEDSAYDRL